MCVGADLVVDKTAVGSYDTTYTWAVDKTFLDFPGSVAAGTEVTIPYEVTAIKTGQIDSGWTVSGTITVTNLNTWQPVTLTGVTDTLVSRGLVTRVPSTVDRRLVELTLTPYGQTLMTELYPEFNRAEAELVTGIPDADLDVLTHALRQIVTTAEGE